MYKIGTSEMTDYSCNPASGFTGSRYGTIKDLDATTEEFTLRKDRSFTFAIDKLDTDETAMQLEAASALARQVREVVVPEVDIYYQARAAKTAAGADSGADSSTDTGWR